MSQEHDALENRYFQLRWGWYEFWESDPDHAIGMIEEAIDIAEQLDKPHWVMENRHWLAQALVFKKRDYTKALPLAVQSAVEVRKPIFQGWQTRICLYQDLIAAHIGVDAITHAGTIEAALDRMQVETSPESQCTRCLLGERTSFELKRNDLDAARLAANTYLSKSWTTHHRSNALIYLTYLAFLDKVWTSVLEHAEAAEKLGDHAENPDTVVHALMWQAAAHCKLGDLEKSLDCFRQSEARRKLCGVTFGAIYWTARVVYHELTDDIDGAIASRQEHLQMIAGHGALREEAEGWIDLCRLQKRKGKITEDSLQQAHAAINKLTVKGDLPESFAEIVQGKL